MTEKYKELKRKVEYAKTSVIPRDMLYEAKGAIDSARELEGISHEEYMELNKMCVADGINNPKYFGDDQIKSQLICIDTQKKEELKQALDSIDETVDALAKIIDDIAHHNDDFYCTECLRTAARLFSVFEKLAREEDTEALREKWTEITGRDITDA